MTKHTLTETQLSHIRHTKRQYLKEELKEFYENLNRGTLQQ